MSMSELSLDCKCIRFYTHLYAGRPRQRPQQLRVIHQRRAARAVLQPKDVAVQLLHEGRVLQVRLRESRSDEFRAAHQSVAVLVTYCKQLLSGGGKWEAGCGFKTEGE